MKHAIGLMILILFFNNARAQEINADFFVNQALSNSPLLQDLSHQGLSLQLDSQIYQASLKPQVVLNSTNLYAPVIKGYGYDGAITNGAQASAVVTASKEFVSGKTLAARLSDLALQQRILTNSKSISEQDIRKMVIDQYVLVYGEQVQIEFLSRINKLLAAEDTLLQQLTRQNVYKQTDYLLFSVTRQQQQLSIRQQQIQYEYDYRFLNYLSGIHTSRIQAVAMPAFLSATNFDYDTSIFSAQFRLDSLKLLNDRRLIDINYRPRISVYADAGYNSSLAFQAGRNFGTSFGFGVSLPIYDGRQRQLQYRKIDLQEQTRRAQRNFFDTQRQQQIDQLNSQLNDVVNLTAALEKQVKYAETLVNAHLQQMRTGDVRLQDFVLAFNNYLDSKNQLTKNNIDQFRIINQLNYWNR